MKQAVSIFATIALAAGAIGCSSSTLIRSTDSEAKIYVDGEYKGKGQFQYSDTKTVGSMTSVRLQKDGCEPMIYNFYRNEEFDAGACAGGVFVLVPFLWIQKYRPEHVYEYECKAEKK